jgi:DNA end-binding protein Ku
VPKDRPAAINGVNLLEALRRSVGEEADPAKASKSAKKPQKAGAGQKEAGAKKPAAGAGAGQLDADCRASLKSGRTLKDLPTCRTLVRFACCA